MAFRFETLINEIHRLLSTDANILAEFGSESIYEWLDVDDENELNGVIFPCINIIPVTSVREARYAQRRKDTVAIDVGVYYDYEQSSKWDIMNGLELIENVLDTDANSTLSLVGERYILTDSDVGAFNIGGTRQRNAMYRFFYNYNGNV